MREQIFGDRRGLTLNTAFFSVQQSGKLSSYVESKPKLKLRSDRR